MLILNKADQVTGVESDQYPLVSLTEKEAEGFDIIKSHLLSKISTDMDLDLEGDDFLVTKHRHKILLEDTLNYLRNFIEQEHSIDMACEELRAAAICLGRVTGHIDVEEVLDVVFRDFCIGK